MIIFYITYIIAILLGIFCPNQIVLDGSETTEPVRMITFVWLFCIAGGYFWLRHYRNNPVIGPIYRIVQAFFIVLFATLFANYAKKEIKRWWKED